MQEATLDQGTKILAVFKDTPVEQVQAILASGFLADLRDGNIAEVERNEFRRLLGLNLLEQEKQNTVLSIDRSTPFNPAEFIGTGWTIWKGPVDGDGLSGEEDRDERSFALTEFDPATILLEICIRNRETRITGEERILRLKVAGRIRLDAGIFHFFWRNQQLIPKEWKKKINGEMASIFFDGMTLRSPYGGRYALYLYFGDGRWVWGCDWLDDDRDASYPSAVLASI